MQGHGRSGFDPIPVISNQQRPERLPFEYVPSTRNPMSLPDTAGCPIHRKHLYADGSPDYPQLLSSPSIVMNPRALRLGNTSSGDMLQSVLPAAVFTICLSSSVALIAGPRDMARSENIVFVLGGFIVVYSAVRFGGRRGLGALWLLMLVWLLRGLLMNLLNSCYPFLYRALGLPNIFFYSSMLLGLPLFFATWVGLRPLSRRANIRFACVTLGWLVLIVSARLVLRSASDVYVPSAVPEPVIVGFGLLVLAPALLIIAIYFAQLFWKRDL